MSPEEIRAAAGAHLELGPEYSDAVVASFLQKVDQEIAARVDERLATSKPRARPAEREDRRTLLKGFVIGVASTGVAVLLVDGTRPGHHALILLAVLIVLCGAGVRWASQHLVVRRAASRRGPRTADGDRWI